MKWGTPSKSLARHETILEKIRHHFGKRIPKDRQYWTLAGSAADDTGALDPHSEFVEVTKAGLVTPDQFYGVDYDRGIIKKNQRLAPAGNWIWGDFSDVTYHWEQRKAFVPAVVNFDSMWKAERAATYFEIPFIRLSRLPLRKILLIFNVILKTPYDGKIDSHEVIEEHFAKLSGYNQFWDQWETDGSVFVYPGRVERNQRMGTFVLFKP